MRNSNSDHDSRRQGSEPDPRDLAPFIESLEGEIAEEQAQVRLHAAKLAEAKARLNELQTQRDVLARMYHERTGGSVELRNVVAHPLHDHEGRPLSTLPRTKAILRVLEEASGPLHRQTILDRLREGGFTTDTVADVSGALGQLHRNDKVVQSSRGVWTTAAG